MRDSLDCDINRYESEYSAWEDEIRGIPSNEWLDERVPIHITVYNVPRDMVETVTAALTAEDADRDLVSMEVLDISDEDDGNGVRIYTGGNVVIDSYGYESDMDVLDYIEERWFKHGLQDWISCEFGLESDMDIDV